MTVQQPPDERLLRLRLAADTASVPGARRFVADGLRAWGHDGLVDDAALCVSELAGNAALHGNSTYIEVSVLDLVEAVRVLVEDDGVVPADAVVPRTTLPEGDVDLAEDFDELDLLDAPATGRGLAIVSVLARDWGVEELDGGKRVWAELALDSGEQSSERSGAPGEGPDDRHDAGQPASGDASAGLPEGWAVVRLAGCPVELSLRQDQHLDELVRELTLMSVDQDRRESADLAERLKAILRAPAHARLAGRRQAEEARDRGERLVDVEMAMPRDFSKEVRLLQEAVAEADVLCDEQRLLTLASPRRLREFRRWMTEEIVGQLDSGTEPVSWDAWRARR